MAAAKIPLYPCCVTTTQSLKWKFLLYMPQHTIIREQRALKHYYITAVRRRQGLVCLMGQTVGAQA